MPSAFLGVVDGVVVEAADLSDFWFPALELPNEASSRYSDCLAAAGRPRVGPGPAGKRVDVNNL